MTSAPTTRRRILLASLAGPLAVCAAAGGGAWYATRCDRASYQDRASTSWVNDHEKYLFACGQVWHSLDAGQTWQRIPSGGLPLLARDGRIAIDRAPGYLYLGLLLADPSTIHFRALNADPTFPAAAWAIIQHEQTSIYSGANTGGRSWLQTCVENPPDFCDPPAEFMAAHYAKHTDNP